MKRLVALALALLACRAPDEGVVAPDDGVPGPLSFENLVLEELRGTRVVRRLGAVRLAVAPRRLGPLQLGLVQELVLAGARLELFLDEGAGAGARVPPSPLDLALRGAGRPASGAVHGLEWRTSRGGREVTRVRADRAKLDVRRGDLVLDGFRIVDVATGRTLEAPRAAWRAAAGEFVIDGAWTERDGAVTRAGRGLRVDCDYQVTPRG